jgi:hypothetical protein
MVYSRALFSVAYVHGIYSGQQLYKVRPFGIRAIKKR